ncbi:MAG TPA: hypothetical protein VGZ06_05380 [Candidatus Cybelea sp.]|nr:hypothetical protein [Candidatus Cybelea sp.]
MRRHSMLGIVAMATFAGCGAPQPSTTPFVPQNAPVAQNSSLARSWMLPEAKSKDLLYVANVYTITVYSYPQGKLVGTLKDFYKPYGECVDKSGDVYVTDSSFGKIYEYAHGSTKPIHTLNDPSYVPYGCAVDPTTGDLAVANYSDDSAREGNVMIYHKAKGFPKSYIGYGFYYYYYLGYDPKGNLYVDGLFGSYGDGFEFGELRKGGSQINPILLPQTIRAPGGIQWDGQYLALGDNAGAAIYQFSFSASKATLEGTTPLTGAGNVGQFGIAGSSVVTPNQFFSSSGVLVFPYPGGGAATKTITHGVFYPFSAVVSPASGR